MAAAALLLGGCGGIGLPSEALGGAPATSISDGDAGMGGGSGDAGFKTHDEPSPSDAAANDGGVGAVAFEGSPLCMISLLSHSCSPDHPACLYDVHDGGTAACQTGSVCKADAGVPIEPTACRVGSMGMGPVCGAPPPSALNFSSQSAQGDSCAQSSDCNIGFECVGGSGTDSKTGTCKHYCCDPSTCSTVSGAAGDGGTPQFCDIEPALGGELVPVCTSGASCSPLTDSCGPGETCTFVNSETGQTACVTTGTSEADGDCTLQKCAANLACIGGTCLKLCNLDDASSCPMGQTCTQPSAFYGSKSDNIGLCED